MTGLFYRAGRWYAAGVMSFIGRFFLLVLLVGFGELYLLVKVSANLSFPVTAAICVFTGVVGGALVRRQGLAALGDVQGSMARGEAPAEVLVSGLVLLIVGVVLILPGFISDVVGFILLIPPLRQRTARWLVRRFEGKITVAGGGFEQAGRGQAGRGQAGFGPAGFDDGPAGFDDGPSARRRRQVIDVDPDPGD